jgi:hypothetical protein
MLEEPPSLRLAGYVAYKIQTPASYVSAPNCLLRASHWRKRYDVWRGNGIR